MDGARILAGAVLALITLGPFILAIWGWVSWLLRPPKPILYGTAWTLMAFVLASASAFLGLGITLYAHHIGGFSHFDPALQHVFGWGLGLSTVAFLFSWPGRNTEGPLRLKAPILSSMVLVFWLLAGLGE